MIAVPTAPNPPLLGKAQLSSKGGEGMSLPPIRTMMDDLNDAARGGLTATGPLPPSASAVSTAVSASPTPQRVGLPADTRPRQRILPLLLFLILPLMILGGLAWAVLRFFPQSSGTVADSIPSEAQAFVSVRPGDAQAATLLPGFFTAMGGFNPEQIAGATDVTYLFLPGPSAAEPVPALLARGVDAVDLSASPTLGVQPVAGGVLITASTNLGRVNAFSGSTWGSERAFQNALRGLPENPPVLMAMRSGALATLLQPFFPHALSGDSSLVMAIVPTGDGGGASVVARLDGASQQANTPASSDATQSVALAGKLPQTTILALERPASVFADALSASATNRIPSGLRPVIQALQERADVFGGVLQLLEGTAVFGVLPTETAGIRDAVAVLPLKPGVDARSQLRALEGLGPAFGPYLTGSAFADAAFTESTHQNVPVRYMNFGSPARALDYTIVGDTLLFTTSRSSMHALLDAMAGRVPTLADGDIFGALAGTVDRSNWVFFRGAPTLRDEFPLAYRVVTDIFGGLVLRPVESGLYTGAAILREPTLVVPAANIPVSPSPEPSFPVR